MTALVITDSGQRREPTATGSLRDVRKGKGRYDLLQWRAIDMVAKQLEGGAVKYGERNWELGQPLSWYVDSGVRHISKFAIGQRDERHEVGAAWNILCLLDTIERIKEGLLPLSLDDIGALSAADIANIPKPENAGVNVRLPQRDRDDWSDITDCVLASNVLD